MINDNRLGETSTQKYRSVVESTWHLIHDPQVALQKLSKAAAKINVPQKKSVGEQAVWDLPYLHQYLDNADVPLHKLKYIDLVETTILRLKAALGWRGADLTGLYADRSFKFDAPFSGRPKAVGREWEIPMECVQKQRYLVAKLVVPYVHYVSTTTSGNGSCACAQLSSLAT